MTQTEDTETLPTPANGMCVRCGKEPGHPHRVLFGTIDTWTELEGNWRKEYTRSSVRGEETVLIGDQCVDIDIEFERRRSLWAMRLMTVCFGALTAASVLYGVTAGAWVFLGIMGGLCALITVGCAFGWAGARKPIEPTQTIRALHGDGMAARFLLNDVRHRGFDPTPGVPKHAIHQVGTWTPAQWDRIKDNSTTVRRVQN